MKIVMLYSGGLDSTVLLYHLVSEHHEVKTLSFNYGQRHEKELDSAHAITEFLNIENKVVDLSSLGVVLTSCLTDVSKDIPEGHYAAETMKSTVVPHRNLLMLSAAAAYASSMGFDAVAFAAHAGDHYIYEDCRPAFVESLNDTLAKSFAGSARLIAPFINLTKSEIVKLGKELDVPFSRTWSCYKGKKYHCGKCGTCVERLEAFFDNNIADEVEYVDA